MVNHVLTILTSEIILEQFKPELSEMGDKMF